MSTQLKESSIYLAEKIVFRLSKHNAAAAAGVIGKSYIVAQIIEDHQETEVTDILSSVRKLVGEWDATLECDKECKCTRRLILAEFLAQHPEVKP